MVAINIHRHAIYTILAYERERNMTTCASIDFEIDNLQEQANGTRSLINKWIAQGNSSQNPAALLDYAEFLINLSLDAALEVNIAQSLQQKANSIGCTTEASKAARLALQSASLQGQAQRAADSIKNKANTIQRETSQSTTSQNNQGTGTPGSAGQGPNATPDSDQLTEIEIQSKRIPEEVEVTGTRRAEDGLDEVQVTGKRNPTLISGDPAIEDQVDVDVEEPNFDFESDNTNQGLEGELSDARAQANKQDSANYAREGDWRVRLSLAPEANYLYRVPKGEAGILEPLQATDGVIFPYTPAITINYAANYGATRITHANYPVYQYENSTIDSISINCDFTAQDTFEANYLLAVIHFFRSVTKMFYGQDQNPTAGTPPPLCYLFGLGAFQFNAHPLVVTTFNYSLPTDVDYIRATTSTTTGGVNRSASNTPDNNNNISLTRLQSGQGNLTRNGEPKAAQFSTAPAGSIEPTYVPTRIQIQLSAYPLVSRNVVSAAFSLKDYATGKLMRGIDNVRRGGLW